MGAFQLATAMGSAVGGVMVAAGALRWTGLAGAVLSALGLAVSVHAPPRKSKSAKGGAPEAGTAATSPAPTTV
ncbi:hypothetical protein [Streptomyces sp. NPDC012450]|uniref:hypothetical protein n=1 Tax=Streptomyces sp. NPDC012450 TaxID=3364834 RepID=UPI0036E72555